MIILFIKRSFELGKKRAWLLTKGQLECQKCIKKHTELSLNYTLDIGSFHRDQNTSLISVLLKKDKPPLKCSSYRPISLITTELKLFAKVLVKRLESCVGKLIHCDQTGFLKWRLASDNVRCLFDILHTSELDAHPADVFSLDALKAFDRVSWIYFWQVLETFGFDKKFITTIKLLYTNPCAVVQTNNILSKIFPLQRGT